MHSRIVATSVVVVKYFLAAAPAGQNWVSVGMRRPDEVAGLPVLEPERRRAQAHPVRGAICSRARTDALSISEEEREACQS